MCNNNKGDQVWQSTIYAAFTFRKLQDRFGNHVGSRQRCFKSRDSVSMFSQYAEEKRGNYKEKKNMASSDHVWLPE